jgi:hypothetical protein
VHCSSMVTAAAMLFASAANAGIIYVDPDQYAPGTDLSNQFQGISLSTISQLDASSPINRSAVYAVECADCGSVMQGQMAFGHNSGTGYRTDRFSFANSAGRYFGATDPALLGTRGVDTWEAALIEFDQGTNYVQLTGGGARTTNFFVVDVWGTAGNHLLRCYSGIRTPDCNATPIPFGDIDPWSEPDRFPWSFTITNSNFDIGYVTAGGFAGGNAFWSFSYNEVPEPATLGMLLIGLYGIRLAKRTTRRAAGA